MKKLIEINGELDEKGTTANRLNILAASKGLSLSKYISNLLDSHVLNNKIKL